MKAGHLEQGEDFKRGDVVTALPSSMCSASALCVSFETKITEDSIN